MTKILIEIDTDTQRVVPAIPTDEIYTSACDALGILFLSERFDAMYAAMLAAAPQPEPVDVWQPIETAPKDEFVLLAGPSGCTTIETVCTTGRMCNDYHIGRWIDHANDDLTDWGFNPTHWMPLPKPPDISQGEKK